MATDAERNRGLGAYSTPGVDTPGAPQPFQSMGSAPQVTFKTAGIDPPSDVYIGREDKMQVTLWDSDAPQNVTVAVRIMRPDGTIVINIYTYATITPRVLAIFTQELTEGFLLSISVVNQTLLQQNDMYAQVSLFRGTPANPTNHQVFIRAFVPGNGVAFWPGGINQRAQDGAGRIRDFVQVGPGAGADWILAFPTGNARWRVQSLRASLVASAAVANRIPQFQIFGNDVMFEVEPAAAQTASTTKDYILANGIGAVVGANKVVLLPLPDNLICVGQTTFKVVTSGIDVADQWSNITLLVEEYPISI